jgi:hypothetical protein
MPVGDTIINTNSSEADVHKLIHTLGNRVDDRVPLARLAIPSDQTLAGPADGTAVRSIEILMFNSNILRQLDTTLVMRVMNTLALFWHIKKKTITRFLAPAPRLPLPGRHRARPGFLFPCPTQSLRPDASPQHAGGARTGTCSSTMATTTRPRASARPGP